MLAAVGVAGELLAVRRHARQRTRSRLVGGNGTGPGLACRGLGLRNAQQGLLGGLDVGQRRVLGLQLFHLPTTGLAFGGQRLRHIDQPRRIVLGTCLEGGDDLQFLGVVQQLLLAFGHLGELRAVHQLRNRHAGLLHRQPHHRHQEGDDQDDVLRHLRPGHRAHATEEGADQHPAQAEKNADHEVDAGQARGDQPDAVDLRDQVHEGTQHGRDHADHPRQVAAVARAEEIRDGELTEFAQIRGDQQRHQAVTPGPAENEGQPAVALQVQRSGESDERRGRHPVGRRGHAVIERRHPSARDVVLGRVGGAAQDADARIQQHRRQQEGDADPVLGHAHALQRRECQNEQDEAGGVGQVDAIEPAPERRVAERLGHGQAAASAPRLASASARSLPGSPEWPLTQRQSTWCSERSASRRCHSSAFFTGLRSAVFQPRCFQP